MFELPRKSGTAEVIRYALARWRALGRFIDDGTIEIDNNAAERSIRPIAHRAEKLAVRWIRQGRRACRRHSCP